MILRAILRAAAFELESHLSTPARAVINEYVEVGHAFFSGGEPKMINGILDALARRLGPASSSGAAMAEDRLPDEFTLIRRYFAPLATHAGAAALGDDVALIAPAPGLVHVLKTDTIVEGVHYFADDPADLVARKLLRVNLSDLAAKGARPVGYLLAASFAREMREVLAGGVRQGTCRGSADLRNFAARRRHHGDAGTDDVDGHGHRRGGRGDGAAPLRRQSRATTSTSAARWATRHSGCASSRASCAACRTKMPISSPGVTACRSHAWRSARR